jgi:hypothetical protein
MKQKRIAAWVLGLVASVASGAALGSSVVVPEGLAEWRLGAPQGPVIGWPAGDPMGDSARPGAGTHVN